jgi:hypothetical protein
MRGFAFQGVFSFVWHSAYFGVLWRTLLREGEFVILVAYTHSCREREKQIHKAYFKLSLRDDDFFFLNCVSGLEWYVILRIDELSLGPS